MTLSAAKSKNHATFRKKFRINKDIKAITSRFVGRIKGADSFGETGPIIGWRSRDVYIVLSD